MNDAKKAFTLIELLIVIGIIAILAALAVENYLTAQIRAKVSRVHADMRTLAGAIEAYHVDHNAFPRMAHWSFYGDPSFDRIKEANVAGVFSKALSTPIAYVVNAHAMDPFLAARPDVPLDERLYTYQVITVYSDKNPSSIFWPEALKYYGPWRLGSAGPDQSFDHFFANSAQLLYDPTNGVLSAGNLWRSQRDPVHPPPVPQLLGAH